MSKTIKQFDRKTCRQLREDIGEALRLIEDRYDNVEFDIGHMTYGANVTAKITLSLRGEDGLVRTPEAQSFTNYAEGYGLKADDLYKTFTHAGVEYKITGLSTRGRKYPILVERTADSKGFKFPVETVRFKLHGVEGTV